MLQLAWGPFEAPDGGMQDPHLHGLGERRGMDVGAGSLQNQEWELTSAQPLLLRAAWVKNGNQSNREQLESSPLSQSVLRNLCLVLHPANPLPLEKQSPFIRQVAT